MSRTPTHSDAPSAGQPSTSARAGFVPLSLAGDPASVPEAFNELARRLQRVCLLVDGETARLDALAGCDVDRSTVCELLDLIREQVAPGLEVACLFRGKGNGGVNV